jgi:inorganic pyrophosphatase
LAVPIDDPRFKNIKDLGDLEEHILKEISDFFEQYKRLQNKKVEIQGFFDATIANQEIAKYLNNYTENKN